MPPRIASLRTLQASLRSRRPFTPRVIAQRVRESFRLASSGARFPRAAAAAFCAALMFELATGNAYAQSRAGLRLSSAVQQASAWGTTIGVLDTGLYASHSVFIGRLAGMGYEVFGGTTNTADIGWHGTAVASVIAQTRDTSANLFDPRVLPIRVFDGPTTGADAINAGIAYSIGRAPIINLSLAATGPIAEAGIRQAVAARQLVVVAAGNRGLANPDWPARYAREDWANGQVIAVGAIDAANQIAGFSNRAGDTRDFFLVAPGVGIVVASSGTANGWLSGGGTSFAAPAVSAAAALVQARWPYLTATQIANILFTTATDLGAPGVDDVYGHGRLDTARALQPIGVTAIPLSSGSAVALSAATLAPGAIAASGLQTAARAGALQSVALDAYRRAYLYDLGQGLAPARALSHEQVFGATDRTVRFAATRSPGGTRTLIGSDTANAGLDLGSLNAYESRHRAPQALVGMAIVQPLAAGADLAFGTQGMAASYFGVSTIAAETATPTLALQNAMPYLTLAPGHHHLAMGWDLGEGIRIKSGLLTTTNSAISPHQLTSEKPATHAAVLEVSRQFEAGAFGLTAQQVYENNSHFGMLGGDAYKLSVSPTTNAFTAFARYTFARHWTIAGQYSVGLTPAQHNTADSLIQRFSTIRTDAFALGLAREELWRRGDQLSLTVSQPLRASAGTMQLDLPTSVDANGNVIRSATSVDLVPGGRETIAELAYTTPLNKHTSLGVSYLNRRHANHDASAPTEHVYAARVRVNF